MHRSLELSNLSKLPMRLRRVANAAVRGGTAELISLVEGISDIPPDHRPFIVPVYYVYLNPIDIPMILQYLDASSPIQADITSAVSPAAFADLWLRVWPWIQFLDEYRHHFPYVEGLSERKRYSLYMTLFDFLCGQDSTGKQINAPVGSYVVVGRAWRYLVHAENPCGFDLVCKFLIIGLISPGKWDPRLFEELLVGVGGTRRDLARIVVTHLERVIPGVATDHNLSHFAAIIHLAGDIMEGEWDIKFKDALLAEGIVTALTTASLALSCPSVDEIELQGIVLGLTNHMVSCYRWITESLRAGLLLTIFSCASRGYKQIGLWLRELLQETLPAATVYHSVLSQLRLSLGDVRDRDATAFFKDPVLLGLWEVFVQLVDGRLQVLDLYDSGLLATTSVCDNIECVEISENRQFRRCSGCSASHYCSQACQTTDWRHGGHRQSCGDLALRRNRDSAMSTRDRSFLRALLHHDYTTHREQIAVDHLLAMCWNPNEFPCTLFDYTNGRCDIDILTHKELGSKFSPDAARAEAWGGRMQLHLMKVVAGDESRIWCIPLRSADAELVQGLRSIAATLASDTMEEDLEPYLPSIRALINSQTPITH
ncbi:hypothetical protein DFH06DRAFT_1487964 [Mycena polygramma]|nr:hypothetical protein DFH06DRAFT_1487964 [Mycena polygramma]